MFLERAGRPSGRHATFQAIHCTNAAWGQIGRHLCHLAPDERMPEDACMSGYHSSSRWFTNVLILNVVRSTVWEMQLLNILPSCPVALHCPDQQCDLEMQNQIPCLNRIKLSDPSPHNPSKGYDQELDQGYAPNALHILMLYQYAMYLSTRSCSPYGLHSVFSSALPLLPRPGHAVSPNSPTGGPRPLPTDPDSTI